MYRKYIKRILDIFISLIILLVAWPLLLIIGFIIKLFDHNQERTGLHGKKFKMYKFKTMKNKRVTKIGKFLRITSLDELPQFINILKGDMSFVGPRPWIPDYFERFTNIQKKRVDVKPGMIGLAQVNGRNNIDIFKKIDYDIEYINNLNFLLDVKIIFKSFRIIIVHEDVNTIEEHLNKELQLLENQ